MMDLGHLLRSLLSTAVFAVVGIVVFALAFWLMTKISPFSIRKEIEHDHNTALAVIIGAIIVGLAMIVSAAIVG
jgi:putative membrane protein